jgi:hypothetical protein
MKTKIMLLFSIIMIALASQAFSTEEKAKEEDFTKHPGYVDFDVLKIFGDRQPKVEVSLRQPMLKMASKITEKDNPELFKALEKLSLIRVYVFDADSEFVKKFNTESAKTIKKLDNTGWERVVSVHEDDESAYIYLRPSKDSKLVYGIAVIAVEKDDEAVFVNIVGEINPDDVGQLGKYMDIEQLGKTVSKEEAKKK